MVDIVRGKTFVDGNTFPGSPQDMKILGMNVHLNNVGPKPSEGQNVDNLTVWDSAAMRINEMYQKKKAFDE